MLNETVTTFGSALTTPALDSMRRQHRGVKFDSITPFYPVPVGLVLPYEDRNITIDFGAAEPARPKLMKYQYMLDGFDKGWEQLNNNTTAVFSNLPEGNYTFKLKALSPGGVWSSVEYTFRVLPPWYRAWWVYALYLAILITAVWCFVYYRSRNLLKANRRLEDKVNIRTQEVLQQKEELQQALEELKATQRQLIQSEKMASLGEFTADIAHEIQNPLNFVNNFSEVSIELMDEMAAELSKGEIEEAKAIAGDIKQNLEKINHHGNRADAIVKGILQHSRASSGQKEPADINALADEYLRLAYHGMRANDKIFSAAMHTGFDEHIVK